MPNEVIDQVHRLAIAAEKYDGIVFTDADGNILSEQFSDQDMDDNNNQQHNMLEATEQDVIEQSSEEPEDSGAIAGETASTTTDEDNMDEAINDDMSNGTSDSAGNANEGD